jgi:hypothetical protein
MDHINEMLGAHPAVRGAAGLRTVADGLRALHDCATACASCADACVAEPEVAPLRATIRLNLDCAAICAATADVLARRNAPDFDVLRTLLHACMLACAACAAECDRHAPSVLHCGVCADACRACEAACRRILHELPTAPM